MSDKTTIQISLTIKKKLDELKISDRETYNEIIEHLIEDSEALDEKFLREINEAVKEYNEGKFVSHEEVKRQLGF